MFDHLIPKKVELKTYVFQELVGEPSVNVLSAGEENKPFFNAALRVHNEQDSKKKLSVGQLQMGRDRDRILYVDHIIKGWCVPPLDSKGVAIPFSRDVCLEFLRAIPDDVFDGLRRYCSDTSNFRILPEPKVLAGNSPTG